jgi:hydroxymethylpyrimidine/phosphomethylpyrimidine kinase
MIANALSIAGSDPSGGAGIQADLKTFAALGVYGAAAITALTAQNTRGVARVMNVPPDFVAAQLDALFEDLRIDAVKIGMVANAAIAETVAERLARQSATNVVLDPVMVAKSGDSLLDASAVDTLRAKLVPLATVITPNLEEAAVLLDEDPAPDVATMREVAQRLRALGPRAVLLKGGHLSGDDTTDILLDGETFVELPGRRLPTKNTHGTGCTLSSAIAAYLARGSSLADACRDAKTYLTAAIAAADQLAVGNGNGPVHHFHALWQPGA